MKNKDLEFYKNKRLSGKLENDVFLIKNILRKDSMLRVRRLKIGNTPFYCALFFTDGMASGDAVTEGIVKPVIRFKAGSGFIPDAENLLSCCLYAGEASTTEDLSEMLSAVLYGDTLLLIDGQKTAVTVNTKGWRTRGVDEPPNERVQQGPREGFGESALLNVALIRRKLKTPDFCAEPMTCGKRTETQIYICYLNSLADKNTLDELRRRISVINTDGVLDTNYLNEFIKERKHSLFKTAGSTERPDIVAARLLEGRVAVIADGTPSVLTVPYLLSENFQSDDDYYLNFFVGSIGRAFRLLSFFVACFFTGLYVALVTFHAGLIPTASALAVLRLRIGVPSSTLTESLILIIAFEILREACARAPRDTGTALGVVGGLVIGEAAVNTETVSAPTLIIVALAGICSVMIPRLRGAVFFINLVSTLAAGFFGLFGLFSVCVAVLIYILGLSSFGVDYTEAFLNPSFENFKDVFFRVPWSKMILRPPFNKNKRRQRK